MMAPVIDQLKTAVGDKARILKINVDKAPVVSIQHFRCTNIHFVQKGNIVGVSQVQWDGSAETCY